MARAPLPHRPTAHARVALVLSVLLALPALGRARQASPEEDARPAVAALARRTEAITQGLARELGLRPMQVEALRRTLEFGLAVNAPVQKGRGGPAAVRRGTALPRAEVGESDMHPALSELHDTTLDALLRLCDGEQRSRYLELLGKDGVKRLRALAERRARSLRLAAAGGGRRRAGGGGVAKIDFDKDGDGLVSREEVPSQLRSAFSRFDADGDGSLNPSELDAARAAAGGGRPGGSRPRGRR